MSKQENPTPTAAPVATPEMVKAWEQLQRKEGELTVARDRFFLTAKTATTQKSWDKKQLTIVLLTLMSDPARVSEAVKFVFPANAENRAVIDEAMALNAAAKSPHDRPVSKPVLAEITRSKEPITIEQAKAAVAAKKSAGRQANPPGGPATPPATPARKLTAQEQSDAVQTSIIASMKLAETYGFDFEDWKQEADAAEERFNPFKRTDDDETES